MWFPAGLSGRLCASKDRGFLLRARAQVGLALEGTELLKVVKQDAEHAGDLEVARNVQESLLPAEFPDLPGWEFAAMCRPARYIRGDYYDVFKIDAEHTAVVLGDVSGKGLGPLMQMSKVRAMIRSRLRTKGTELQGLLEELNSHLLASSPPEMYIALFIGILHVKTGSLRYVNAGHVPAVLLRSEYHEPLRLERGGMVLGVNSGEHYEEADAHLEPGDILALFSDGLTGAMDETGDIFGEERLSEVLVQGCVLPASAVLSLALESVYGFAGEREQSDDIALVIVRRAASTIAPSGPA